MRKQWDRRKTQRMQGPENKMNEGGGDNQLWELAIELSNEEAIGNLDICGAMDMKTWLE